VATKTGWTTNISSFSFIAVFVSGIRDPESRMYKNQDSGSGINMIFLQYGMFYIIHVGTSNDQDILKSQQPE
jgi:hypothetical protein